MVDGAEAVKSLAMSKLPTKSGLNEKMELLQSAEEKYYKNKSSDKQVQFDIVQLVQQA